MCSQEWKSEVLALLGGVLSIAGVGRWRAGNAELVKRNNAGGGRYYFWLVRWRGEQSRRKRIRKSFMESVN